MVTTLVVMAVLAQNPAVTPAPIPPPVPVSAEQRAIAQTAAKVEALKAQLKAPGVTPRNKVKLKKALQSASARAREARDAAEQSYMQRQQQAYVDKMMPIWLEQQRQNAQFNIEAQKLAALQSMANTAKQKAMYDVYYQQQQLGIMADEARSLRALSNP